MWCPGIFVKKELSEFQSKMRNLDCVAKKTAIFADNLWRGQSIDTIHQLQVILD